MCRRHGSLLGLGQIFQALVRLDVVYVACTACCVLTCSSVAAPGSETHDQFMTLIQLMREKGYFSGMGGELVKRAGSYPFTMRNVDLSPVVCKCLGDVASSKTALTVTNNALADWQDLITECLLYNEETLQNLAYTTQGSLAAAYYHGKLCSNSGGVQSRSGSD